MAICVMVVGNFDLHIVGLRVCQMTKYVGEFGNERNSYDKEYANIR